MAVSKSEIDNLHRKDINMMEASRKFNSESKAEAWFIAQRWPSGIRCPHCDSDSITNRKSRKPMPFHCRSCRKYFSVRTGTTLSHSKLPLSKWAMALYLLATNPKGISSPQLHRNLGITQKTAWHLNHRAREGWNTNPDNFFGPVEVDETYIGGKEGNKHNNKKLKSGRGAIGKIAVVGIKDRNTNTISAAVVESTDGETLRAFVHNRTHPDAIVYTDQAPAYRGLDRTHEAVNHGIGEYVRGAVHTNGIESFWSKVKRAYMGTYHWISSKHLQRYINEFSGRHNMQSMGVLEKMEYIAQNMKGKRLRYQDLVAENA